jgi:hypothetical protein
MRAVEDADPCRAPGDRIPIVEQERDHGAGTSYGP